MTIRPALAVLLLGSLASAACVEEGDPALECEGSCEQIQRTDRDTEISDLVYIQYTEATHLEDFGYLPSLGIDEGYFRILGRGGDYIGENFSTAEMHLYLMASDSDDKVGTYTLHFSECLNGIIEGTCVTGLPQGTAFFSGNYQVEGRSLVLEGLASGTLFSKGAYGHGVGLSFDAAITATAEGGGQDLVKGILQGIDVAMDRWSTSRTLEEQRSILDQ